MHKCMCSNWLPVTFVILLFVKVVSSEMQIDLLLKESLSDFNLCCTNYEVCVRFMRHVDKYHTVIMNAFVL